MPQDYRRQLNEAKKAYKAKDYPKAYEIYTNLYYKIPFDNSNKYSYAWTVYQLEIKDFTSKEDLLKSADLITQLTRQNNLNHKINPDLLDQVRFTRDDRIYPSNMEQYYIWASVTYLKIGDFERCIKVSKNALSRLNRFTGDSAEFFQWRIAKSYRQIGNYDEALKFLKILRLDEWYVFHEIAENYYYLDDHDTSLEYALKAAIKSGPMNMKFNLYTLLASLIKEDYPDMADKHELLCDLIIEDSPDKEDLETELEEFWKRISKTLSSKRDG